MTGLTYDTDLLVLVFSLDVTSKRVGQRAAAGPSVWAGRRKREGGGLVFSPGGAEEVEVEAH